jgi:predicted  nucleic acid-binding Zn-ribbon protein
MPKPWDEMLKHLIELYPQDFVSWVLEGARVDSVLKQELQQTVYADSLIKVLIKDEPAIVHFEFQLRNDSRMSQRVLVYNMLASYMNDDLPVYSYVLYLRPDSNIVYPPFVRTFPDGEEVVRFKYKVIKLWETQAQELLKFPFSGLLPLVLLAKDGTEQEIVDEMIEKIADTGDKELLAASYTLGGLVFKVMEQRSLFTRRFYMFQDILEESWTYQEMKQRLEEKVTAQVTAKVEAEARAKAEAEVRAEIEAQIEAARTEIEAQIEAERAKAEGQAMLQRQLVQRLREALMSITEKRFPSITRFARGITYALHDPTHLSDLIADVGLAQTPESAMECFISAIEKQGENENEQLPESGDE